METKGRISAVICRAGILGLFLLAACMQPIAPGTLQALLEADCLAVPAGFFRAGADGDEAVRFYRYPITSYFFNTEWTLVGQGRFDSLGLPAIPAEPSYFGYVADERDLTPGELSYEGPLPRLSFVAIPFADESEARRFREAWAAAMTTGSSPGDGFRRAEQNDVIQLVRDPAERTSFQLFQHEAAGLVLEDGRLVLLQSNLPGLIAHAFEAAVPCAPPPVTGTPLALGDSLRLARGTYDIPFHTEPDNDVAFVRQAIDLGELESEYSAFQPQSLANIESEHRPGRILAYRYSPLEQELGGAGVDEAEVQPQPVVQVCLGCFGFYMSGQVLVLEFEGEREAAAYAGDVYAWEFGRYGGGSAHYRHGAVFPEPHLAYRLAGRNFYILSSWMPETIDAILTGGFTP